MLCLPSVVCVTDFNSGSPSPPPCAHKRENEEEKHSRSKTPGHRTWDSCQVTPPRTRRSSKFSPGAATGVIHSLLESDDVWDPAGGGLARSAMPFGSGGGEGVRPTGAWGGGKGHSRNTEVSVLGVKGDAPRGRPIICPPFHLPLPPSLYFPLPGPHNPQPTPNDVMVISVSVEFAMTSWQFCREYKTMLTSRSRCEV